MDIDDVVGFKHLKTNYYSKFCRIKSDVEKMEFICSKMAENVFFNISDASLFRKVKDNEESSKQRRIGNKYFACNKLSKALKFYNKSICFAEGNTESLGISYANRSAIYFRWKKYELCLANIDLACQNKFPPAYVCKLINRKQQCKIELERNCASDVHEPMAPILSFPPHPKVPFIANCLELRQNQEFGRHIVTKTDLSVGQVVVVEDSFCSTLEANSNYERCANCLQKKFFNLFPCERCTVTMFCSETCATEADKSFHRIECAVIDFLSFESNTLRIIRPVICILSSCMGNFDALRTFMNDPKKDRVNAFTLDYQNEDGRNERYKAIHTLEKNVERRSTHELFDYAVMSAFIYTGLMKYSPLSELLTSDSDKKLLQELIFHYYQIVPSSSIPVFDLEGILPFSSSVNAQSLHGLLGLLNHSCAPNCSYVGFNRHTALIVSRPIKAGDQLFISYGMDHCTTPQDERQHRLLDNYCFQCRCEACKSGYYYDKMSSTRASNVPSIISESEFIFIVALENKKFVQDNLKRYIEYVETYDHHYPCSQLCAADGCLLACWHVLYNEPSVTDQ